MAGLAIKRVGVPGAEPVSLAMFKAHLSIEPDFTDDDDLLNAMLSAAREDAEDFTGRSLVPQQWLYALDRFPRWHSSDSAPSRSDYDTAGNFTGAGFASYRQSGMLSVPNPPLVSIDSITYSDTTNTVQTLAPAAYQVDTISEPGRICPAYGGAWPATAGVLNAVQITFSSGYPTNLPFRFIQAIKLRAATYYANREEFIAGTPAATPEWFERMLSFDRTQIFGHVTR